jgi:membrane protease subunit (stomatin/prohibitin family)
MGFANFFKKQFVSNIEWNEHGDGVLAFRYPMHDNEIQNGGQLTVRETQAAMFVNEGEIADLLGAGLHTLTTKNLPMLTDFKNWDKGFTSPFKSDVYFFSLREQVNQRWGSQQPIVIRDKELGPLRIRAFGSYSYRIADPKVFFKKLSGTSEIYSTEDLEGQLRAQILTSLATFFGGNEVSFFDMAANQSKFSDTMKSELAKSFSDYGLELTNFYVQSISLPDEVQSQIDKLTSMRMTGDLQKFAQFQGASSIPIAAANQGGAAGAAASMGVGLAMGQTMSAAANGGPQEDPVAKINQLHELLQKNIITQAEFDAKKSELLKRIT